MTHGNICMKTNRYSPCIHVDDGSTAHNPLYKVIRIINNVGVLHIFLQRHITKTHVRGLFACDYIIKLQQSEDSNLQQFHQVKFPLLERTPR